jgi:hypothetical protein
MDIIEVIKSDVNNAGNVKIPSSGLETEISDKIGKQEFDKNLDYSIKTAIGYCRKNNIDESITNNFNELLVHGTKDEKYNFIYGDQFSYNQIYGRKIENSQFNMPVIKIPEPICGPTCVEWGTKEVCVDKEVCETVCVAGAVVCYTITLPSGLPSTVCGPGAAVCNLVCKLKPNCTNVPVCKKVETTCE